MPVLYLKIYINLSIERGQGLNHSITDAGNLVKSLKADSCQSSAIAKYEEEMIARAGEEVHLSVINTTMLHDWSKVLESPVFKQALAMQS